MSLAESWGYLDEVRVRVPAKINLALCVGGTRPDGYHELATIFQAVSVYDTVTATCTSAGITCETIGPGADKVGPPTSNLAYLAAQLLRDEFNVTEGAHLSIDKQIPVAAGLGGGSSDAAAALVACARIWELRASSDDLARLAARVGADAPFALSGGCAVGLGRGEVLTPALSRGTFHWVLAIAKRGLSTPEVYRRFDEMNEGKRLPAVPTLPGPLMMAVAAGNLRQVAGLMVNDLAPAACSLYPELTATLAAGRHAGCLGAMICGSGPTVAFLAENEEAAIDLAVELSTTGVAQEIRVATGPVQGATIV